MIIPSKNEVRKLDIKKSWITTCIILGNPRMGKTTLIKRLVEDIDGKILFFKSRKDEPPDPKKNMTVLDNSNWMTCIWEEPPFTMIIDEVYDIYSSGRQQKHYSFKIVKDAEGRGINVIFVAHSMKEIPTQIRHYFNSFFVFKMSEKEAAFLLDEIGKDDLMAKMISKLQIGEFIHLSKFGSDQDIPKGNLKIDKKEDDEIVATI
jgi:hypothetical protein